MARTGEQVAVMTMMIPPGHRYTCRGSVLECEPKYRVLRAISKVARLPCLRHTALRERITVHWHFVRTRSSWSRA
jgi:hypothetical protein